MSRAPMPATLLALAAACVFASALPAHAAAPAFVTAWGTSGSGTAQFNFAHLLAVAPSGDVYVGDLLNNRVQRFTSFGAYLGQWPVANANGIAVAPDGTVYVVSTSSVGHYSAAGAPLGNWGTPGSGDGQFDSPIDVAVDADGYVYVVEQGNSRVQKFASDGTFVTKWGSYGLFDGQFEYPAGISVTPEGEILVSDFGADQIQRFTNTGVLLHRWGALGTPGIREPGRAAIDPDGNLLVPESNRDRIAVFAADSTFKFAWGAIGYLEGQFNNPTCIAFGAAGQVYVMDKDNDRVQVFESVATPTLRTTWGAVKRMNR